MKTLGNQEVTNKKQKESSDLINRVRSMIIFNALVNFLCKIPVSVVSINDLRLLMSKSMLGLKISVLSGREHFKFLYDFNSLCEGDEACLIFMDFCHLLYYVSMSVNLFFLFRFDFKFKNAFKQVFFAVSNADIYTYSHEHTNISDLK